MINPTQTICLCMIVKNEAHVIRRCLDSVRPLMDTWVICDTGSTDGTQEVIREHLRDLPGELIERPWVDLAFNRTDAITFAHGRADYLLVIDADEVLIFDPDFERPVLTADDYLFAMESGSLAYYKVQLMRDALDWRYGGVVHDYAYCAQAHTEERLPGVKTLRRQEGARSRDPLTYRRDALLLEEALLRDPTDTRNMFYLAQSYADAQEPDLAIDRYKKRVAMGGWPEEVWYSLHRIAQILQGKQVAWPLVLEAYLAAFAYAPKRAEPLFHIGYYYQARKEYAVALLFFEQALMIPYPAEAALFVEKVVYDVFLPLEFSVACFYVGRHDEAIDMADELLERPDLPADVRTQVTRNQQFSRDALAALAGSRG